MQLYKTILKIKLIFLSISLLVNGMFGITYLRIISGGVDVDTVEVNTPYYIEMDCAPAGSLFASIVKDVNSNRIVDDDDIKLLDSNDDFIFDNQGPDPDGGFNPFFDYDSTLGIIRINMPIWFNSGDFIFGFFEEEDSFYHPLHFLPLDSTEHSISGRIIYEDLPLPDTMINHIGLMVANSSMTTVMTTICDSMGNYHTDWPISPGVVTIMLTAYGNVINEYFAIDLGYEDIEHMDTTIYLDGHLTDVDFHIPFWIPDTTFITGLINTNTGAVLTIDSIMQCFNMKYIWDEEADSPLVASIDTFIADCVAGSTFIKVPKNRYDGSSLVMKYLNLPFEYMRTDFEFGIQIPSDYDYDEVGDTNIQFYDTLLAKNDTFYVKYFYTDGTTPLAYNIPLRLFNWDYGFTDVSFPPDTLVGVWVYSDSSLGEMGNHYNAKLISDTLLPENYGFHGGETPGCSIDDTLSIEIGQFNVFVSGTLFSAGSGLVHRNFEIQVQLTEEPWGDYYARSNDESGIYSISLFDEKYRFEIWGDFDDFMTPPSIERDFNPGNYTVNFTLYPLDTSYWLYLEIDSDDPMDDSLSAILFSPDSQHTHTLNFSTNRWVEMPIYSGFTDSCRLWIRNRETTATWWLEAFTRIIENNGKIGVMPGDSLYLTAELPVDEFTMEFQRDSADYWQYSITPGDFKIKYHDLEDTHLVYTYYTPPNGASSITLPIFEEQLLIGIEPPYNFARHHFIANPDDFLRVGGPYRPDRVVKHMNSGSGEMLLTLDGYPAEYLGDDTIWFDHGDFSCVETPDFPGNHYIAELFLFKTRPTMHPWGDASVMAFHDVCDGQWTVVLPDSLPGGFVPSVSETSFYCTDIDSYPEQWQEFPIIIPVGSPDGVHGWINRQLAFFEASETRIDYYSQTTDSLLATKYAWQYQPWGDLAMFAKYFIKETELPHGDYYTDITYLDWPEEQTFIYPERIDFTYSGDSLLLPDTYIGMAKGKADIEIDGLDSTFYSESRFHLLPLPDSIPDGLDFYSIDAVYSFPKPDSTKTLKIPTGSWIVRPVAPFGLTATPPETVLHVRSTSDTILNYDIIFSYDDISANSIISGKLVRDTLDPAPVCFDTLIVRLIGYGDTLAIYETEPDDSGCFVFDSILAPSNMRIDVRYDGGGELFQSQIGQYHPLDAAETLDVGEIFVDNANATVNVAFHGLDFDQLSTISWTQFIPLDGYMLGDTFNLAFPSGETRNSFKLCDGEWRVFPQKVLGVEFVPMDTVFSIDESHSTYSVTFVNPAGIGNDKLPRVFAFSAYPNPFNDVVVFEIALPKDSPVRLGVYDLAGRRVTEIEREYEAGVHRLMWNGKGEGNSELSSGVYLYRIETGTETRTIKGVYLK